jgi:multiple sugar transport system substrate-binding protein
MKSPTCFRNIFSSFVICTTLCTGFFGFDSQSSAEAAAKKDDTAKIEINYAFWNRTQEPAIRKIADNFESTHPTIKINLEVIPYKQLWTKLEVASQGGSAPDIFWMNGDNFIKYAKNDMLLPLNDKIENDNFDMSVYPRTFIEYYSYHGKSYGIPKDWDTIGLFYNKELFDAAHEPYPTADWNWDKLVEVAGKLTNKEKNIWGIAASCTDQQGFFNTIYQNNGYVLSGDKKSSGYDKRETIKGVQCWVDLIQKGFSPTYQQMTDTKPEDLFASGKVAMIYAGSWMSKKFMDSESISGKFNVEVLPKMEKRATIIHGVSNVIYKETKHPDEAWEFIKYMGGREAGEILAKEASLIPANKEAVPLYYESYKNLNLNIFTDQLEHAIWFPVSTDSMKWILLQQKYMAKAWAGEMSVEQACKTLAKEMNEALANEQ